MFEFIGVIGFIGCIVFIIRGVLAVLRKKGEPKKQFKIAGLLFIAFIIGMAASPVPEESSAEQEEVAVSKEEEKETETEEKVEIAPSTVADITSAISVDMAFDAYNEVKENKLNVEIPETLSIGNGNVGTVLQATDGFVVVGTDGTKVLSVETFATIDEAKAYGEKLAEEAKVAEAAAKEKAFEDSKIVVSGSGDTSTDLISLEAGFAVFEGNYSGSRNFIVQLMDENGNNVDLLVNEIGSYNGKTFATISSTGDYYLNVKSSGNWNFTIYQTVPPTVADAPTEISGHGDDVVFVDAESGNYKLTSTHQGSSNFIVRLNGSGLLVNEIGAYNGSTRQKLSSSGVYAFVVNADGNWSIRIEE